MSELTWHERLNHVRFSRLILFADKWLVLIVSIVMLYLNFPLQLIASYAVFAAVMFGLQYAKHTVLEDAAGLPTNHLVIRY